MTLVANTLTDKVQIIENVAQQAEPFTNFLMNSLFRLIKIDF
jgi:hypothetical protein